MHTHAPTTSFGRRPVTLDQIATQLRIRQQAEEAARPGSNAPAAVNKWRLFRTLTEIRERLGVSDRSLSVLNALLSFHPETALSLPTPAATASGAPGEEASRDGTSCDLVVFPSNRQLGQRAHGMAPTTLWRHLTALVAAGLISRRDSPNGKRYARKDDSGRERFSDAFGFDLTPLVVRAGEFEAVAEELRILERRRGVLRERISLHRRDVGKLIACALDEGLPGDWEGLRLRYMALMTPLRRLRRDHEIAALEAELGKLRADVAKALESRINAANMQGNDHCPGEHQSNSNTQSPTALEPASAEARGEVAEPEAEASDDQAPGYPLGMVLEACPDIRDYAPSGAVRSWSDFIAAAAAVRPMIGISPDAWREAQDVLGRLEAHILVATILQRSIHSSEAAPGSTPGALTVEVNGSPAIQSAGGYLRALTGKAREGAFALGPVLMALIGQRLRFRRAAPMGRS